jgi:hypothetical protein
MRNSRKICPCCGYDINEPEPEVLSETPLEAERSSDHKIRKVTAKAGVKMCAICMSSVAEEQLIEQDGQKICPTCADSLKSKAAKKAAGGGPPK